MSYALFFHDIQISETSPQGPTLGRWPKSVATSPWSPRAMKIRHAAYSV
jgi:hypothetical protein